MKGILHSAPIGAPEKPAGSKTQLPSPEPLDPTSIALVNKARVAIATGLAQPTIDSWVRAGKFPEPIKLGECRNSPVRWRWRVVQEWISSHEARPEGGE